jgi:hypothetical protein
MNPYPVQSENRSAAIGEIVAHCHANGCKVVQTSQFLIIAAPFHRIAFVEVPHAGGKRTPIQVTFQAACERAGGTYILAYGVEQVRDWLGAKTEGGR